MNEVKMEMRKRARLIRGTINVLVDDASYICEDAAKFDLVGLGLMIPEVKDTIQDLIDHVIELEYMLYLTTKQESS